MDLHQRIRGVCGSRTSMMPHDSLPGEFGEPVFISLDPDLPCPALSCRFGASMAAYAIAHLHQIDFNAEIVDYLRRIDATLAPFGGRFLVHGTQPIPMDGSWEGTVVVIEFADLERARAWYDSPQYQAILPLRTRNTRGEAILVDGVGPDYRATSVLDKLGMR